MSQKNMRIIVGSDSLVGKALMQRFEMSGEEVIGTTRRRDIVGQKHLYLNLLDDPKSWSFPSGIDTAFICAGVTKLEECRRNPDISRCVNVDGTCELIKNLIRKGVFVIYLSTNQVFNGSVPYCLPDEKISPITEYGRQKADTEYQISKYGDSVSIIRFTKILGARSYIFSEWIESFKNGKVIHPFIDMHIAPIPVFFAAEVLRQIGIKKLSGVLQVSGNMDISYADVAYRAAALTGADPRYVQPVKVEESGKALGVTPVHTTLNMDRIKSVLGIEPPDVWWTIEKAFIQSQALEEFRITSCRSNKN